MKNLTIILASLFLLIGCTTEYDSNAILGSNSGPEAITCQSGYVLVEGACLPTFIQCDFNEILYNNQCHACPDGMTPNNSQTQCQEIDVVSCHANEIYINNNQACQPCSSNQVPNSTQTECNYCPTGKRPAANGVYCEDIPQQDDDPIVCPDDEIYTDASKSDCQVCAGNAIPSPDQMSCVSCPSGQQPNSTGTACEDIPVINNYIYSYQAGFLADVDGCNSLEEFMAEHFSEFLEASIPQDKGLDAFCYSVNNRRFIGCYGRELDQDGLAQYGFSPVGNALHAMIVCDFPDTSTFNP